MLKSFYWKSFLIFRVYKCKNFSELKKFLIKVMPHVVLGILRKLNMHRNVFFYYEKRIILNSWFNHDPQHHRKSCENHWFGNARLGVMYSMPSKQRGMSSEPCKFESLTTWYSVIRALETIKFVLMITPLAGKIHEYNICILKSHNKPVHVSMHWIYVGHIRLRTRVVNSIKHCTLQETQ